MCPTAYQAARPPRHEPQGDITKARRIAHDRGQVRQPRGLFAQTIECRPTGQVAGRRRVRGHRGRMAGRGSAHARQATPYRDARVRAARGRARVHGLVLVGAALDQALEAGASSAVGRFRRVGVGAGKRAGRFRPGPGRDRRSRTRGAFPGGVVPVFEHALGGRPSRRDLGVRVPGFAVDLRAHGHGAWGGGVRQRRRRGPSQAGRHGRPDPLVLPVLRALRVRAAVPRPVFRPREGQCGERRRLRQAQPDGADAVGRELPNADACGSTRANASPDRITTGMAFRCGSCSRRRRTACCPCPASGSTRATGGA